MLCASAATSCPPTSLIDHLINQYIVAITRLHHYYLPRLLDYIITTCPVYSITSLLPTPFTRLHHYLIIFIYLFNRYMIMIIVTNRSRRFPFDAMPYREGKADFGGARIAPMRLIHHELGSTEYIQYFCNEYMWFHTGKDAKICIRESSPATYALNWILLARQ